MVLIEDITEQEAERQAAEDAAQKAAEAAEADARQSTSAGAEQGGEAQAAAGEGPSAAGGDSAASQQPAELTQADKVQLEQAEALKKEGNVLFASGQCEEALAKYAAALEAAPEAAAQQRAVYHGNRAACHAKREQWAEVAQECSAALELDAKYTKVLLRRSAAYEKLDDLERALADAEKVLELDPGNAPAAGAVKRLTPVVMERREKLKEEMLGKLKDLGNMVLGKFGLSMDNFKAEQDPSTGSYSIKFQQ